MSVAAFVLLALGVALDPAPARAQERPNVLLIVADDLGVGEIGPYGQERIATPHLDRLAASGARFTAAYSAAPVCAPSRCAILTGLAATHCSAPENARPNTPLSLEDLNLGLLLSIAGYRTALVGKWGLGGELDDGSPFATFSRPDAVGFDVFAGVLDQELAQDPFPAFLHRGRERTATSGQAWIATLLVDEALSFLREAPPDRPFFLLFAPTLPHREIRVPPEARRYDDRGWPEIEATYASMVGELDDEVGRLLAMLDERGLRDRTLVLFTSDHGPHDADGHLADFFAGTAGLRGQKRDLYEGGLRVPLLVAGPGVPPRSIDTPVALYDLMPTIAEAVGVPVPPGLDGRSIAPLLAGETMERGPLVFSSDELRAGEEPKALFRVRDGELALVELMTGASELYELVNDPAETRDLSAERPDDVARLRAIRERLTAPRPPTAAASLEIEGVAELDVIAPSEVTTVLWLDFETADPLASRVPRPARRAVPNGGAALREGALHLPRSPSGEATAHAVLGAHPALSFGRSSFTFRARVRLTPGDERATIACARPAGRPARFTDWAILARVGAGDGRIGVVLGDPTVSGRGLTATEAAPIVPLVGTLAIDDDAWHELEVVFDLRGGALVLRLDGREERLPAPHRVHYPSDGPLVLGACLDEAGRPEGGLVGAIDDVVLARGAGPATLPEVRRGRLDARGEGVLTAHFTVTAPRRDGVPGRALALELTASGDGIELPTTSLRLLPGQSREVEIVLRGPPGPLEGTVEVIATDPLLGTLAHGAPLEIAVRGELTRPPSAVGRLEGALVAVVLGLVALVVWRTRKRGAGGAAG